MSKKKQARTKLLVSVTGAVEAITAMENGADLIDIKDPSRGSLGAASPDVWREVLGVVNKQVPVSAALGEIRNIDLEKLATETRGLSFAKVGMSDATTNGVFDWRYYWRQWRSLLKRGTQPVLVVYADWRDCGAPSPAELVQCVPEFRVPVVLVDTYDKSNGNLREHCSDAQLIRFIGAVRDAKAQVVLAGSLQLSDLPDLLPLAPDYVAVRGAVCRGARTGRLDGALVREWATALSTSRK
ncbi:(5-formylfuran-3-yl)methyl phosphate synthase [Anatilimnocola floriformis]|uniref:(5-formylfuran-3-yl)methyl phosphate synthase n=1 Tax=Anatilimnocola floriformis TaxID=2948575 RepID=UPI0020C50FCC|nr:(5-formylfuran-3-yl)methyl phosphate synthase [Anatilimnocola floriformis]